MGSASRLAAATASWIARLMSPVGGVGINLAIQDAVAAANLLAEPILENRLKEDHLHQVQRRRNEPPV